MLSKNILLTDLHSIGFFDLGINKAAI